MSSTEQDFVPLNGTDIIFPTGASASSEYCEQLRIIDDGVREEIQEDFIVMLTTTDIQVILQPDTAHMLIVDLDSEFTPIISYFNSLFFLQQLL